MRRSRLDVCSLLPHGSRCVHDDGERAMVKNTIVFLLSAYAFVAVLFFAAFMLTGCSELKFAECVVRDNTRNPCN